MIFLDNNNELSEKEIRKANLCIILSKKDRILRNTLNQRYERHTENHADEKIIEEILALPFSFQYFS